jgi:hypothetical protein
MSGQGRGRYGHGRFEGRFHKKRGSQAFHKKSEEQPKESKVLADYIFHLGSAKQASDYELVSQFIINHIRKEFTNGEDISVL